MSADTLIFVDVDGVLNIGARDGNEAPLLFSDQGVRDALRLWGKHEGHPQYESIERLASIARQELGHGEGSTYLKLTSSDATDVSDVLVGRLADLIRMAGEQTMVVLSSKWQQRRTRVRRLESCISAHLRCPFKFDARTAPHSEIEVFSPEGRLQAIGDFVEGLCSWRGASAGKLRILLLEDFHMTPMDGWSCDGSRMESTAAAEEWLQRRVPAPIDASVKLVHTYDEWRTPGGLTVQVGTGLVMEHFRAASLFLSGGRQHCGRSDAATATVPIAVPAHQNERAVNDPKRHRGNFPASRDRVEVQRPAKALKC